MADTSELLRLCDEVERESFTDHGAVYWFTHATKLAYFLKSRLQAEAPEDAEVDEEHPLVEHVARAIAVNGVGRPWDDFAAVNAHDMDQGDLKQYALAAIRATPRTSQAEAQAPTTAALTEDERRLLDDVAGFLASENSLVNSHEHARKIRDLRVRLTVGAPAPAPTMPTPGYPCAKCNRPVNHTLWGTCVECQRIAKGDTP